MSVKVFRLHIIPKGGSNTRDEAASFGYCLENKVLGVGWQVEPPPKSWDDYVASVDGGPASSVRQLHDVARDDLIWTKDRDGRYYLARALEPWRYFDTPQGRAVDIVQVVDCDIRQIDDDTLVPGKVISSFIRGQAFRHVPGDTTLTYSQLLWNKLAKEEHYHEVERRAPSIFDCLDPMQTEDVIFIYLQLMGWVLVPSTRGKTTKRYEYLAINREDPAQKAIVQVKTGTTRLPLDQWADRPETVYLFQAQRAYSGQPSPNVVALEPDDIERFMRSNRPIMPGVVQLWMDWVYEHRGDAIAMT